MAKARGRAVAGRIGRRRRRLGIRSVEMLSRRSRPRNSEETATRGMMAEAATENADVVVALLVTQAA
jgi:hypothetical protein